MGVLNSFLLGGLGIRPSKKFPGGFSQGDDQAWELTDTLQTCKIIDSVDEITMRTSWLCYQLSFTGSQIWCRDSFQEGIDVCQISLSCISINIVLQRWGGGIHSSSDTESQKTLANSGGTIVQNNLLFVRRRG